MLDPMVYRFTGLHTLKSVCKPCKPMKTALQAYSDLQIVNHCKPCKPVTKTTGVQKFACVRWLQCLISAINTVGRGGNITREETQNDRLHMIINHKYGNSRHENTA